MGRAHGREQLSRLKGIKQVGSMPAHGGVLNSAPVRNCMYIEPAPRQKLERVTADEPACASYQNTLHAIKSGKLRSVLEITHGSIGHWISNAGSFHRTARWFFGS